MKKRMLIWVLVLSLLLSPAAMGAMVMGSGETAEVPRGEEVPAAVRLSGRVAPERPAVGEEDSQQATLAADGTHTATAHDDIYSPLTQSDVMATSGVLATDGVYYLAEDITGNLRIGGNAEVNICLNGHKIIGSGTGSVITVTAGSKLYIYDCDGGGQITGGMTSGNGGGVFVNRGTFGLYGGSITGNVADGSGGGVFVSGGAFSMYGGSIAGNVAGGSGGGVSVVGNGSVCTLAGGSITGNTATGNGGGVIVATTVAIGGAVKLSGAPVITGNKKSDDTDNNLYLNNKQTIEIIGALTGGNSSIGLTMAKLGTFTSGTAVDNTAYAGIFFVDGNSVSARASNGQLALTGTLTYNVPAGVTGTAPEGGEYPLNETVKPDSTVTLTKEGYEHAGWSYDGNLPALKGVSITGDIVLLPVFVLPFHATGLSDVISVTYGVPMDELNLNDYVEFSSAEANASKSFTFAMAKGETRPDGIQFSKDKIMGTPNVPEGQYKVKFTVQNLGASLLEFTPGTASQLATLTLTFDVAKKTPDKNDFTLTLPEEDDIYYTGEAIEAEVVSNLEHIDQFQVKYYDDQGQETQPIEAGTYTVKVDVTGNDYCTSVTGITDPSWIFTIIAKRPATLDIPTPTPTSIPYGQPLSTAVLPTGWVWVDGQTPSVNVSSYQAIYTIPADTPYDWTALEDSPGSGTVTRGIALTVRKATPTPDMYTEPTGLTAMVGETLADVMLPDGWRWAQPSLSVGEAGRKTFKAIFTPTDTVNYTSKPNVELSVVVTAPVAFDYLEEANTIHLTVTPTDLLKSPSITAVAVRLVNGAMKDVAWGGTLNTAGDTVTFAGKTLALDSGWKLIFLDSNYAPVCPAVPLVSPKTP